MPARIRQTRWRTADGKFFDDRDQAVKHEKIWTLAQAIRDAVSRVNPPDDQPAEDWCMEVATFILAKTPTQAGFIFALAQTKEQPR